MSAPRVLFLDEPTVGLDPRIRHELLDLIVGLRDREDMTIVVTTHYLDEMEHAHHVGFIDQGKLIGLDTPLGLKMAFVGGSNPDGWGIPSHPGWPKAKCWSLETMFNEPCGLHTRI